MNYEAQEVLLDFIGDVERADEFANRHNQPDIWSKLGQAYLHIRNTNKAVDCFYKAKDPSHYIAVIGAAES